MTDKIETNKPSPKRNGKKTKAIDVNDIEYSKYLKAGDQAHCFSAPKAADRGDKTPLKVSLHLLYIYVRAFML